MAQKKILFLAANPKGTSRLRLDEEVREIEEGLLRSEHRQEFDLVQKWAVRPQDIRRALLKESPNIIHFSGHGESTGQAGRNASETRNIRPWGDAANSPTGHLIFEDNQGNPKPIAPQALADLFELFAEGLDCVVLNACYSEAQAQAIAKCVPYVVGTNKAIGDRAAIEFAIGFYDGLGAGRPVDFAFKLGRNAIAMEGLNEELTPVLVKGPDKQPSNPATNPPDSSVNRQATRRSPMELIDTLARLPNAQFSQLVFVVNPPPGVVPNGVGQLKQAEEFLTWARNDPSHTLAEVEQVLDEILGNPQ